MTTTLVFKEEKNKIIDVINKLKSREDINIQEPIEIMDGFRSPCYHEEYKEEISLKWDKKTKSVLFKNNPLILVHGKNTAKPYWFSLDLIYQHMVKN